MCLWVPQQVLLQAWTKAGQIWAHKREWLCCRLSDPTWGHQRKPTAGWARNGKYWCYTRTSASHCREVSCQPHRRPYRSSQPSCTTSEGKLYLEENMEKTHHKHITQNYPLLLRKSGKRVGFPIQKYCETKFKNERAPLCAFFWYLPNMYSLEIFVAGAICYKNITSLSTSGFPYFHRNFIFVYSYEMCSWLNSVSFLEFAALDCGDCVIK